MATPGRTLKLSPCAWPTLWYGSWPRISTRARSSWLSRSAANRSASGGNTSRVAYSDATNADSVATVAESTYGAIASRQSGGIRSIRSRATWGL